MGNYVMAIEDKMMVDKFNPVHNVNISKGVVARPIVEDLT